MKRVRATARSRAGAAAMLALAISLPSACSAGGPPSFLGEQSLRIGVKADQPGLGLRLPDGRFAGFDVDVARYVAAKLGVRPDHITFVPVTSATRETALENGSVDMVFATYSITPERETKVTFGGPYYVAHQDTMVRRGDTAIRNVHDLKGKRLCAVAGSNSWKRVTQELNIAATLVPATSYSDCVAMLLDRRVDAVSTDDLILAGFAVREGPAVRIVNAPFSDERYGIGIKKGDLGACEAVNRAVSEMYLDGTAAALLQKWFGKTGLQLDTHVPQFEGCG
ncbi:MAG TPA: glutamate ABC transporter substrate-binding protein [Streptosporangiaceae bacterium]|nr:glutamate ABC transporter substrate-binding protein [Streptosporangiaceae bacterium]